MADLDLKPVNVRLLETAAEHGFEALHELHYEIHGAVLGIDPGNDKWRHLLTRIAEVNSALYEIVREAEQAHERSRESEAAE